MPPKKNPSSFSLPKPGSTSTKAGPSTPKAGPSSPKAGPSTSKAEPSTSKAEPSTLEAGPSTPKAGPSTPKAGPSTLKPGSYHLIPGPYALMAGPSTSKAGPSTSNPGPSTSKSGSYSFIAGPSTSKAGLSTSNPGPSTSKSGSYSFIAGPSTLKARSSTSKTSSYDLIAGPYAVKPGPCSTSKAGSSKSPVKKIPTKGYTFMNLLQGREMGMVHPYQFTKTSWQMKVEDYKIVASHEFKCSPNILSHTTYFLRGGSNGLVAAWYVESDKGFTSVVAHLNYDLDKVKIEETTFVTAANTVIDACQAYVKPDIFVFISCDRYRHGILNIASPKSDDGQDTVNYSYRHPSSKPFNCCNSNFHTKRFAVGLDREVCVYTVTGLKEVRLLKDNIHGMAYNKKGTILYMGCEKGDFILYDLRSMNTVWRLKLDNGMLDDVAILSNEYLSLVSGPSGKLVKVDIRNKKVLLDFPNHERRSRKIPVSFNETFELVSCTGADDKTRLWSLRNGDLLHTFDAPSTYPARSCLVPNSSEGQIHLIQDNFVRVYGMLR